MKTVVRTIVALALLALLAIAAFVYFGIYNVEATHQDNPALYHFLHYAMRRSVAVRSGADQAPDLSNERYARNGIGLFRQHCVQCHGAPGIAPEPMAFGMRPVPPNLVEVGREWRTADIYWVIKHGVTKSPMPAWEYRLNEQQMWELTAFIKLLPMLSPIEYQNWNSAPTTPQAEGAQSGPVAAPGNPDAGRHAMQQYLCITCHTIPGVTGAAANVGPPLNGIATRRYIGGVLTNTQDNMMRWLRDPQQFAPQSAMPNLHIRENDLRDIVAYLYTLDDLKGK